MPSFDLKLQTKQSVKKNEIQGRGGVQMTPLPLRVAIFSLPVAGLTIKKIKCLEMIDKYLFCQQDSQLPYKDR